jgi:flagellum-specific peptidoglycan hydrolase FlgJ
MKTLILIMTLTSAYWIKIGFKEKNYPIAPVDLPTEIVIKSNDVYAGRTESAPTSKYNSLGLPKDRQWLTSSEWRGDHVTGERLKRFKEWKDKHINSFIEWIALAVQEERANYPDLIPSVIIAQSILESNFNKSRLSVEGNNLFGHKYRGDDDNFLICADDSPTDRFTIYRSRWYSLRGHTKLLYSKYRKRIQGKPTIDKWIAALCNGANSEQSRKAVDQGGYVYATSCMNSCYQCKLKRVIESYDLQRYDN